MKILVSAHNPMTGPRHLGHHVSTMREWPRLQDTYECFFVIDDLIANLMYPRDRADMFQRSLFVAREFLSCGIDVERASVVLTSMIPESLELMVLLSNSVDQGFCRELFKRSFLGLLSSQDREELGLPLHAAVAELIYPQLALPALTLGLGATAFQGGEEISGYLTILRQLVERYNRDNNGKLEAPAWEKPHITFLKGTDGQHMMSANAIYVSEPLQKLHAQLDRLTPTVRTYLGQALGGPDFASKPDISAGEIKKVVEQETRCYRESKITPQQTVNALIAGAARAKYVVRKTLLQVRSDLHIPHVVEY